MSLQSFIVKTLLKLPPSWLVKISGGEPVVIGGRTLDPYFQFVAHGAKKQPPMSSLTAQEGRAASAAGLEMFQAPREPGVSAENFSINGSGGHQIPVRLYKPEDQDLGAPMMVFYHFGGGVIGDLETCDAFCTIIASTVKCPVLSVDYRLAPEHKFPAGLNDCKDAYEWALKNAEKHGAPSGQAAIGGDSMGGNFVAIISQDMQSEDKPLPSLQLMIYPAVDISEDTPSKTTYGETYPLSTDTMNWFMGHYIPDGTAKDHPRLSPAQTADLSGLPPAIVITAGFDPLVDEGAQYAKRLNADGVNTIYKCYDSLAHGFTAFTAVSPAADAACREIAGMIATAYSRL